MSKRILIVDDDEDLSGEMAEFLGLKGYAIDTAADGIAAASRIRKQAYDVFLVDYKMAGLTGVEVAGIIREIQPQAKIILITGRPHTQAQLRAEGLSGLVDEVMGKPFDAEDLLSRIQRPLQQ